jgi:hypothetical protein
VTVYGYLHRGRIISVDVATGGFNLQSIGLSRTSRWGPVQSAVPGLGVGDRVILGATGTSRDELVIIAKVGAGFPGIGDIPGLTAALAGKADDSEITEINNELDTINGTLDDHTALLGAHTTLISDLGDDLDLAEARLDTLEALDHVRIVSDLDDIATPFTDQLAWLTTERRFYRWDTAESPSRWSKSAVSGQVIGGKRRIADASATSGTTELQVLDTGAIDFELFSTYEIKATVLWTTSASGNDFVFQMKETDTGGVQRTSLVAPRTDGVYAYRTEITYLKVTGLRENALTHIASVQRVVGSGTCTVFANSYMDVTYRGPGALLGSIS